MAVYFIQHVPDGLIKIGWADNVARRLKTIQSGSPVPLIVRAVLASDKGCEAEFHARFDHWRQHGEWFEPADEILAEIASINAGDQLSMRFSVVKSIADWINRQPLSLKALAKATGVSVPVLRELAKGESKVPKPATINALLAAKRAEQSA